MSPRAHLPFSVVLGGGGARGFAHAGVLRGLESMGYRPAALVGVSMGAVVAATYALREDWYRALLDVDTRGFPRPGRPGGGIELHSDRFHTAVQSVHVAWSMVTGWGAPDSTSAAGQRLLVDLVGEHPLEGGRVPVVVCATDLWSGARVELTTGPAKKLVYASAALAGVARPLEWDGRLLADGAYADIAPVDVARAMQPPIVIAIDPGQATGATEIHNGVQAVLRAMEICHSSHAELRFQRADLVLRPTFPRYVDTLDFEARRSCVAAGIRAARSASRELAELLGPPPDKRASYAPETAER